MLKFRIRKGKKQSLGLDRKQLEDIIQDQLGTYVRREDLRDILNEIEKDKRKAALIKSLPPHKRKALLQYIQKKKAEQNAKR